MDKHHLLPILIIGLVLYLAPQLRAGQENQAALVIDFGGGDVRSACVSFSEAEISGYELLQRSPFAVESELQGLGAIVCSIENTGCPASNCWCQCSGGGSCVYWSYWHLVGGSWAYSQAGASQYPVRNGAVEGWVWGPGTVTEATPPPALRFDEVCAAATPTNTPTIPATNTPQLLPTQDPPTAVPASPTPSHTPLPSRTPSSTATAVFTTTTTATATPNSSSTPTADPNASPTPTATALLILPTNTATRQRLFTEPTPLPPTAVLISPTPFPSVTSLPQNPASPQTAVSTPAAQSLTQPQPTALLAPPAQPVAQITATFTPLPAAIGANRGAAEATLPQLAAEEGEETAVFSSYFSYAIFIFIVALLAAALLLTRRKA